jgi:hypothetical protein
MSAPCTDKMSSAFDDYLKSIGFLVMYNLPVISFVEFTAPEFSSVVILLNDAIAYISVCSEEQMGVKLASIASLISFARTYNALSISPAAFSETKSLESPASAHIVDSESTPGPSEKEAIETMTRDSAVVQTTESTDKVKIELPVSQPSAVQSEAPPIEKDLHESSAEALRPSASCETGPSASAEARRPSASCETGPSALAEARRPSASSAPSPQTETPTSLNDNERTPEKAAEEENTRGSVFSRLTSTSDESVKLMPNEGVDSSRKRATRECEDSEKKVQKKRKQTKLDVNVKIYGRNQIYQYNESICTFFRNADLRIPKSVCEHLYSLLERGLSTLSIMFFLHYRYSYLTTSRADVSEKGLGGVYLDKKYRVLNPGWLKLFGEDLGEYIFISGVNLPKYITTLVRGAKPHIPTQKEEESLVLINSFFDYEKKAQQARKMTRPASAEIRPPCPW